MLTMGFTLLRSAASLMIDHTSCLCPATLFAGLNGSCIILLVVKALVLLLVVSRLFAGCAARKIGGGRTDTLVTGPLQVSIDLMSGRTLFMLCQNDSEGVVELLRDREET